MRRAGSERERQIVEHRTGGIECKLLEHEGYKSRAAGFAAVDGAPAIEMLPESGFSRPR